MALRIGLTGGRKSVSGPDRPEDKPTRDYWEAITAAGGTPIVLTPTDGLEAARLLADLDGLLFMGGEDISPSMYGEAPVPELGPTDADRDALEKALFDYAWHHTDLPILGICRGLQFMNVALGGTLYQDLPTQRPGDIDHAQRDRRDEHVHGLKVSTETAFGRLLAPTVGINTLHHQAIKDLAPGLIPVAWSPDGVIEAVVAEAYPFRAAVQWHPEVLAPWDPAAQAIFKAFLAAVGEYVERKLTHVAR